MGDEGWQKEAEEQASSSFRAEMNAEMDNMDDRRHPLSRFVARFQEVLPMLRKSPRDDETEVESLKWADGHIPETDANILSRLFYVWAQPMFRRAAYLHRRDKALQHEDLLPLPEMDYGRTIGRAFDAGWEKVCRNSKPGKRESKESEARLRRSLQSVVGRRFMAAGLIKLLNTCLQFSFPLLLNELLAFIEDIQAGEISTDGSEQYKGYWLASILFVAMAAKAVTENFYFHAVHRAAWQARVAASAAVYEKALRLASSERQGTTLGELVNLMQVDATKIEMVIPQIHVLWDGIVQIAGYMTILYTLIGWPCFAGLVIMACAGPSQGKIMKRLYAMNREMVGYTDARVKTTNEALQGVQCVKMYTWESNMERKIEEGRGSELRCLKSVAYLKGASRSYMSALPGVVAVVSFIVYAVAIPDAKIAASTLFAALVAFDQLRFPLLFYPMALAQLVQAQVSMRRVGAFLGLKEVGGTDATYGSGTYLRSIEGDAHESQGTIVLEDATIHWSDPSASTKEKDNISNGKASPKDENLKNEPNKKGANDEENQLTLGVDYPTPILKDVTMKVAPGELCAVVGKVGCGKSTLCSAVLNETVIESGKISMRGTVAYAAQSPWILNASLQDNILFGLPMDEERYNRVVKACQLTHDLQMLENGDQTVIGERGINLSGGQKQRVSVARAAYADADIIILDDPLSALDPQVGRRLFEECIVDLLKGKTRLLVTNQLQCLRFCDAVVALGNGGVIEVGTFRELSEMDGGEVQRLLNDLKHSHSEESADADSTNETLETKGEESVKAASGGTHSETSPISNDNGNGKKEGADLMTKEERKIGAVAFSVYKKYLKAGGGYLKFAGVFFAFILCTANALMNSAWLSLWTSDANYERRSMGFYLGLYAVVAVTLGLFTFVRAFFLARFAVKASECLHNNLLASILNAPMSFFDTTPTGRIISRFSKDMHAIDQELSDYLDHFLFCSLNVVVALGTIIFVTPLFGVVVVPIMFVYFKVLNYFREVSRETKRLESLSRSPVFAQFSETLGGLATIRAYGQSRRFVDEFDGKLDENTRAYYCNKSADRWLSVRLELIGSVIAGLTGVFSARVVVAGAETGLESDSTFASMAGLSLTYAISITSMLNWCVRTFAQLEAGMNASERVLHYSENIPQEAPSTSDALAMYASSGLASSSEPSSFAVAASGGAVEHTAPEWPQKGAITLNKLLMKYRTGTPLVLKGLNVAISGGERIGVVGRTGSGKSSLLLCLMRIVEPQVSLEAEAYEAPIMIDGIDVLRIGLKDLRSKLGIIPQNPVLFSGTVRSNLDPFDEYTDEQVWAALKRCGMKTAVEAMPDKLNGLVAEYGDNLSQGQRQLLCLGRALLKQCRILLLDEATSSVDFETDREIQRTLRDSFARSTVLTIAHRVNTIMDSDKILVMKDGVATEFAPPEDLLGNEDSLFSEIVRHAKAEHS